MKTKSLPLYLILFLFMGCDKSLDENKFFNINDKDLLEICNMTDFWGDDDVIDTLFLNGIYEYSDSNLIGEIRCFSLDHRKDIGIEVYNSKENAQLAIDKLINTVKYSIDQGNSNKIREDWWYIDIPNSVFVNKWNTIIKIAYGNDDFSVVQDTLYDAANELIYRIEKTR